MSRLTMKNERGEFYPRRYKDGYGNTVVLSNEDCFDKLGHYEDLEDQLEKLYGNRLPLDKVVDNLNRVVQNGEEKLDLARILTNAEAEKWDRWKSLEEQGRLAEVIRCKDCIRYGDEYVVGAGWCDEHEHLTNDDDYCSYAVAKLAEVEGAE